VLSDSALSVLVPILEDILKLNSAQIREVFESYGLALQEWDKTRVDWLTFQQYLRPIPEKAAITGMNVPQSNSRGAGLA
jgi:hypothetical protein